MGYIGSFGEELLRAIGRGAASPSTRLIGLLDPQLKRHGITREVCEAFKQDVRDDPGLAVAILDDAKFFDALCDRYIERRAAHLRAQGAVIPAGQPPRDSQSSRARREPNTETRGGHHPVDTHGTRAPAPKAAPADGGAPQDRAGQKSSDIQSVSARPAPNPPRGLAAMKGAAAVMKRCVLDTLTVNGQPLRAVTPNEALGWAETMKGRAETVARICSGLAPLVPVGQQLSDAEAEARAKA